MLWRSSVTRGTSLLVVVLLTTLTTKTVAHTPLVPDAASQQHAAELRKKANVRAVKGDLDGALADYKASFELDDTCAAAANLGALELQLGKYRDAAEHLSFASRSCGRDHPDPGLQKTLTERLAQASVNVGTIKIHLGDGTMTVVLDGRELDRLDLDAVYVEPGRHTLRVTTKGTTVDQKTVTLRPGEVVDLELAAPAPTLSQPEQPATPQATAPSRTKSLGWLLGGAGVASTGLAIGIGFAVVANDKFSQGITARDSLVARSGPAACSNTLPQNVAACANLRGIWLDHDTFSNAAAWSLIIGGAVAAGTITYALWPASSDPHVRMTVQVIPLVTPYGGSLLVAAQF